MSFLDVQIIHEDKNIYHFCLPQTKLYVVFMHILKDFYHPLISLLLSTHSFIDAFGYSQVALDYKVNYF